MPKLFFFALPSYPPQPLWFDLLFSDLCLELQQPTKTVTEKIFSDVYLSVLLDEFSTKRTMLCLAYHFFYRTIYCNITSMSHFGHTSALDKLVNRHSSQTWS